MSTAKQTIAKRAEGKWINEVYCFTILVYNKLAFTFSHIAFPSWVLNHLSPKDQPMLNTLYGSVKNFMIKSPALASLWASRVVLSLTWWIFTGCLLWMRQCFGHWQYISEQNRQKSVLSWSLHSNGGREEKTKNKEPTRKSIRETGLSVYNNSCTIFATFL